MIDIKLLNLTKTFPSGKETVYALKDISVDIKGGSFTAIQGQSGSGKSTLLNLIAALDSPTSGDILFNEKSLRSFSPTKLDVFRSQNIGFVFQNFMLLEDFSALENVMLPLYIKNHSKKEAQYKAKELMEKLGLEKQIHSFPHQLSGGESQRVAIARAIINHPKLILADEPTGNLDAKNQEIVLSLLLTLQKEYGFTLLLVTHSEEVARQADSILNLHFGSLANPSYNS